MRPRFPRPPLQKTGACFGTLKCTGKGCLPGDELEGLTCLVPVAPECAKPAIAAAVAVVTEIPATATATVVVDSYGHGAATESYGHGGAAVAIATESYGATPAPAAADSYEMPKGKSSSKKSKYGESHNRQGCGQAAWRGRAHGGSRAAARS